jgi:ABC-type transport system involved in cytochrome c biogenesis permease subunit
MGIPYAQAALDIIASTLLSSMVMLALSFMPFRGERAQFARRALVVASLVLQASCFGTIWLHEGKLAISGALLAVAAATVVVMALVAIRRDTLWARFKK